MFVAANGYPSTKIQEKQVDDIVCKACSSGSFGLRY